MANPPSLATARRTTTTGGYTLVELMIVVAIIGTLAALSISGVSSYVRRAKASEALLSLGTIETGSQLAYLLDRDPTSTGTGNAVHAFCPCSGAALGASCSQSTDAVPPGSTVEPNPATYAVAPWTCLRFGITEPVRYRYTYMSANIGTSATFTASAAGDLNGNGISSTFVVTGGVAASGDPYRQVFLILNEDE